MKKLVKVLIISLLYTTSYAQQATEIDSKSVKLPRYANLAAIQAAILTAQPGMMVYNVGTASNWYHNGTTWVNMAGSLALPYTTTQALANDGLLNIENTANGNPNITITSSPTTAILGVFNGNNIIVPAYRPAFSAGIVGKAIGSNLVPTYPSGFSAGIYGYGSGAGNIGVFGESINYTAGQFKNNSNIAPTVRLSNQTNLGPALEIEGSIKVTGTKPAAFKIVSVGGASTNIYANQLIILNTSIANNINDILIITHNYGSNETTNFVKPCGVYWEPGTSTWRIYVEDGSEMPVGITFNVLVIKQ